MKIFELFSYLNKKFPLSIQEEWDNSGIQIGTKNKEITSIILSLDLNKDTLNFALQKKANLIITHHPFFFKGIKNINRDTTQGEIINTLIENGISVISLHTNMDKVYYYAFAELMGWNHTLISIDYKNYFKIVVFSPHNITDKILDISIEYGAQLDMKYKGASFFSNGTGTFMPLDNAKPYIGKKNILNKVDERKIEFIIEPSKINKVIEKINYIHPYETPAIDIIPIKIKSNFGLGSVSFLEKEVTLKDIVNKIKERINTEYIQVVLPNDNKLEQRKIKSIAFCGGTGRGFIIHGLVKDFDLFITSDIDYHTAYDFVNDRRSLILLSHYDSEIIMLTFLKNNLIEIIDKPIYINKNKKIKYKVF